MWISRSKYEYLIRNSSGELILELRRQVTKLEEQLRLSLERVDREQQRADNALDSVISTKGLGPISPPVSPSAPEQDAHAEDPVEVERLQQLYKEGGLNALFGSQ